ncbi:hypothetical protein [Botrimarina sp.]|uniref:hypothetical protein n=1 Tax=Botrimarina sp. TaxID=2795802 RepID=UPI0032ED35AE
MKGLKKFLGETWWLFGAVAAMAIAMGYFTGMWLYYFFPPVLVPVILYMASVRYDAQGNLREEQRR